MIQALVDRSQPVLLSFDVLRGIYIWGSLRVGSVVTVTRRSGTVIWYDIFNCNSVETRWQ